MGLVVSCFSNIFLIAEKMSLWITCTVLICCLITTITVVLGLGIGLGYNYCFIDMVTRYRYVPAHYIFSGSTPWPHPIWNERSRQLDTRPNLVTIPPRRWTITPRGGDWRRKQSRSEHSTDDSLSFEPSTNDPLSVEPSTNDSLSVEPSTNDSLSVEPSTNDPLSVEPSINDPLNVEPLTIDLLDFETSTSEPSSGEPPNPITTGNSEPTTLKLSDYELELHHNERIGASEEDAKRFDIFDLRRYFNSTVTSKEELTTVSQAEDQSVASVKSIVQDTVQKKVIPITGLDLLGLLTKLRANDKNYTLHLVTN